METLGDPVLDADDQGVGLGRFCGVAACGRKLAVERGGALGTDGGELLTVGFDAGRAVGAGAGAAEADGADRPGVLGRPVLPLVGTARVEEPPSKMLPSDRIGAEPEPLEGFGASLAGRAEAGGDGRAGVVDGRDVTGGADGRAEAAAGRAGGFAGRFAGRIGGRTVPADDDPDDDPAEADGVDVGAGAAGGVARIGIDDPTGRAGDAVRAWAGSSLAAELSVGSLDFTSEASAVIGVAPPPGFGRDVSSGR